MTDWVFRFAFCADGGKDVCTSLLGGKVANLAEMASIGLPVPPSFVISTKVCQSYHNYPGSYPDGLHEEVLQTLAHLENAIQAGFSDQTNPLLLSVRSGASVSMPGMMDTVLNLGLSDLTVAGLASVSGDDRFVWDSYRRFIQMYSNVVLNMDHNLFESTLDAAKVKAGNCIDSELTDSQIKCLVKEYLATVGAHSGQALPQDVNDQFWGPIGAVFSSWHSDRAEVYRRLNNIGTAEVESALVSHDIVAEAALVGMPHDIKGQGFYTFVTLIVGLEASEGLRRTLINWVRQEIGPIATPDVVQFAPDLPKTRSGKIMRRVLRKIAEGDIGALRDTTTLADPAVVQSLVAGR